MKVQIEKSFPLKSSPEAAWTLLQDLDAVAECMPGARITERLGRTHFKGTVTVKLGPASMVFRGEVEVTEIDEAGRSLRLVGRGTDNTGTSGAAMDLRAGIEADGLVGSRLVGLAEVSVSGKAATFGGRLMSGVADQVLQQFAANFAKKLPQAALAVPPVPASAQLPEPAADAASPATAGAVAADPPAREINGLALAWGVLRDWFHHLFPARRA
jgi:carbon monoxide dehydrogenase subunit G